MAKLFVVYVMLIRLSLLITPIFLFSCQRLNKKADFYNYNKDWDLWRVPILEPYEIVSPTEASDVHEWYLIIKKPKVYGKDYFDEVNEYKFQLSGIDSIGISDSILIFKCQSHLWPKLGGNYKTTFIIDAKTGKQFIFADELNRRELLDKMNQLEATDTKLYDAQKVKDTFQTKMVLPKDWH